MPSEFGIVEKSETKRCLYELLGYSKKAHLKHIDELNYLRKHGFSTEA